MACATATGLEGFETRSVTIGDDVLVVAVADTPDLRAQGLMDVEELAPGIEGMIFVFPAPTSVTFHMRNTLIPLDIWWFDGQGRLLGSTRMDPCPAEPCPNYPSPGEVMWALETPLDEYDFAADSSLSTVESG